MGLKGLCAVAFVTLALGAAYVAAPMTRASEAFDSWKGKPTEPFKDGEAAFHKIMDTLRDRYVDEGLSDDELYHAAARGLLEYVDPTRSAWNKLMTPTEYQELTSDMNGEIVGIGLDFGFEAQSGMGVVRRALPGTPAAQAGLLPDDRILQVDGQAFAGKQQRDMVYAIRGKIGTAVTLTVLRAAKVFDAKLVRAKIGWEDVEVQAIDKEVALLTIHAFTKGTPDKVRSGLAALPRQDLKSLIVDVRGCTGGLFDSAVQTAALLLPDGATITVVKKRGGDEEVKKAAGAPMLEGLQTSVLIDGDTASGCELFAAALKQDLDATLVGTHTFGKWSMQTVDELPNHYAMKYTNSTFAPPNGEDLSGKGLTPDVPVAVEPGAAARLQHLPLAARLQEDVQLQAARNLSRLTE